MQASEPRKLRIDLLEPRSPGCHVKPPEGVTVTALESRVLNGPMREVAFWCFIYIAPKALDLGINVLGNYVYDRARAWKAKRIKVNGREAKDDAELRRIIEEEIEIGKND
jgi:hypothetical protein